MFLTSNVKIHQEWHHICFTLKTVDMNSDGMHVYTKMYLDGSEIDQGKIPTTYLTMNLIVMGLPT